ncbi:S9 family peptidase, partial [Pseudomonas sp. MWU13-2860]
MKTRLLASAALLLAAQGHAAAQDPYLWLENIQGKQALSWVGEQNARTRAGLSRQADYPALRRDLLSILDSNDRIPGIEKIGVLYYNFWRDKDHPRGLWRRTTLDEYRKAGQKWETMLVLDQVAKKEQESWVWKGAHCLRPSQERCLLR